MNLVELEGLQDVWDTVPDGHGRTPCKILFSDADRSDEGWENHPDEYYCWHGTQIPKWFP